MDNVLIVKMEGKKLLVTCQTEIARLNQLDSVTHHKKANATVAVLEARPLAQTMLLFESEFEKLELDFDVLLNFVEGIIESERTKKDVKRSRPRRIPKSALANEYPYGHGGTVPHIHHYATTDYHIKVLGGSSIDRYQIVLAGKIMPTAKEAWTEAKAYHPRLGDYVWQIIVDAGGDPDRL